MERIQMPNASMQETKCKNSNMSRGYFYSADFRGSDFEGAKAISAYFRYASLEDAKNIRETDFSYTNLRKTDTNNYKELNNNGSYKKANFS